MSSFQLKPIRTARVSEISEVSAAAGVPAEDRIDFHIGNPLQDARLSSAFLRIALGIDVHLEHLRDSNPEAILEHLGWEASDKPKLEFLIRTIQRSSPYMPRGGYSRQAPHRLIKLFCSWLEYQQESLYYDTGEQSGRREIILASGGVHEALRVILFALSSHLEVVPARVLCFGYDLLPQIKTIPNLLFDDLAPDEQRMCEQVEEIFSHLPDLPTFLVIGNFLGEVTRRKLRRLSIDHPLFIIEVNDAPNHLSLAREAKLVQRVLRLLTPGIFSARLKSLSTVFIVGNADFLSVIENVHFNLKGTPSASEVEFLTYLLEQQINRFADETSETIPHIKPSFEGLAFGGAAETAVLHLSEQVEGHLARYLNNHTQTMEQLLSKLEAKAATAALHIQHAWKDEIFDEFMGIEANTLLDLLVQNIHQAEFCQAVQHSLISAFVKHQPQYRPQSCLVVSGSSRTALGLLGFHCGIMEVVVPDLSWSYEHCFPHVHAVPLTESLELDCHAMIEKVEQLCRHDPSWKQRGAVVINNPHNATGRIFDEQVLRSLIIYCLQHGLYIIDDLAYQSMAPVDDLPEIKTVRQIASELAHLGMILQEQADRVITIHSFSKTDCLAGARLAVVEIREGQLWQRFQEINARIQPNLVAMMLSYLFYRSSTQAVRTYWRLRNAIFGERSRALLTAQENLPVDRNPFRLTIIPPAGSMYPLLYVEKLPPGLSLDGLSSSLARRGIGLLPLATFARTDKGFETGRKTFRLTLGGMDHAENLLAKTRRLLIDLNRLIAEEDARYNRKQLSFRKLESSTGRSVELQHSIETIIEQMLNCFSDKGSYRRIIGMSLLENEQVWRDFLQQYLPERLTMFRTRVLDRALISDALVRRALADGGDWLAQRLDREFMKDSLERRQEMFRQRSYDRTVHPTQMYSLPAELALDAIGEGLIARDPVAPSCIKNAALELLKEYLGLNVAITSRQEADEILLDLDALIAAEDYAELFTDFKPIAFLSFWSDWDGSNRPSGQGHQLVAGVVMENVRRLSRILNLLLKTVPNIPVSSDLLSELEQLPQRNKRFTELLNAITLLTHQLEQRYRGILPFYLDTSTLRRLAIRLHVGRDPARVLLQHNDRYEQKMLELRRQRRRMLEYYFSLNKQLRKQLHALIPYFQAHRTLERLLREVVGYRDLLQRVVITPRIQEGQITARDQFAIDTTVYNLHEINTITGKYGNPGLVLAIQVSLSSNPGALISLDRKMRTCLERMHRENPSVELPSIWLIPLFEDLDSVKNIRTYLDQIWDYATQSRHTAQSPQSRFAEIIAELFIAGSDLSQQVGQANSAFLYRKAKYEILSWLADRGAAETVRIKLGSGEPMQRQGAYYSRVAGLHAFQNPPDSQRRFSKYLLAAAQKSTAYAVTPLQGVFLGGELRTFQSNLAGQLRFLPVRDFVSLLYHVRVSQEILRNELIRAVETIAESRLGARSRSVQELERLTIGSSESVYEQFLNALTDNFRQILYGRQEDVIGIHIISYFIARSIPQLRDRPTSRRTLGTGVERGQRILANIAEIIPLAKQGSLLRAIAHNQAQTAVLGINQLTTGMFRALERFSQETFVQAEQERMLTEHLLPHLPVYEILHTLRLYQDLQQGALKSIETAFPAGNSAFVALREDNDALIRYLPFFQQELLRRHGVNVSDFFTDGAFIPDLLPTLRPDLAVLLQKNLFNTEIEVLLANISGKIGQQWITEVSRLLQLPQQIRYWRSMIWDVIGESVYQRVQNFAELATALYSFSSTRAFGTAPPSLRGTRLSPALSSFFRAARPDDEMRHFLVAAVDYLSSFAEGNVEVPVSILRAMNDVERMAQIEESLLPPEKQDLVRCCVLQIARLAGENG